MRKILGSWSGMRKYLEQDMIAESLKGRIRYGSPHTLEWMAVTFLRCV